MEVLYALQVNLQRKIDNIWLNFEKKGIDNMNGTGARVSLKRFEALCNAFSVNHKLILGTHHTDPIYIYFCSGLPVKVEESFLHNRLKYVRFVEDFYITEFFSERKTAAKEIN